MNEKRKHPRSKVNWVVSFKVKNSRLAGGSRTKDISVGGVCIPSKHYFPVDSLLEMEIRSDDIKEPIKALAKVVRVVNRNDIKLPFEVGLVFLEIPATNRNIIHDYVRHAMAQRGDKDVTWLD